MGPSATVDFMHKIVEFTQANSDQQHIPLLVASMPDIPDRSHCLLRGGLSPLPALLSRLKLLEDAGSTCIVIPCNTAHFWFEQLQAATSAQMLNLIDAVAACALEKRLSKVGLLSTDATIATRLYQTALEKRGIECIVPPDDLQKAMMEGIYLYKSGHLQEAQSLFKEPYLYLQRRQVEAIILGCTEIPLILSHEIAKQPHLFLDSNEVLARAVIRWYEQQSNC